MNERPILYTDPWGRPWDKESLDDAIKKLRELKEIVKDLLDYY